MVPPTPLSLLGLSFVLGLRHALDVDHLAAVSTIVSQKRGRWSSSVAGALWGIGHTLALFAMALVVLAFGRGLSPATASALELVVAVMLIFLGGRLLWTLHAGGTLHHHAHAHGSLVHVHPHLHAPGRHEGAGHHPVRAWRRPLIVGVVHGLAGSAGLMVVVLATIPSTALALAYVAVFGLGSIAGMVTMSSLLGVPLALATERFARASLVLRTCMAVASVGVGLALAWEIGRGTASL
jgi:high-affinity nickel permease